MEEKDTFLKGLAQVYSGISSQSTWVGNLWSPEDISAEQLITMNKIFLDMISEARVTLGYYYDRENSKSPYSYGEAKTEIQFYKPAKVQKNSRNISEINTSEENHDTTEFSSPRNSITKKDVKPSGISIKQQSLDYK